VDDQWTTEGKEGDGIPVWGGHQGEREGEHYNLLIDNKKKGGGERYISCKRNNLQGTCD